MRPTIVLRLLAAFSFFLATWSSQAANAQTLNNPSFEDSIFVNGGYMPSGWSNSGFGFGYTSDAHHGTKAAKMWNWYYYGKGWIVNGDAQTLGWGGGSEFVGTAVALTGYYKYELGQNGGAADSAYCDMMLFRYNTSTQTRDTLAYTRKLLGPAASYTYFETWVENQTFQVLSDSLVISFASSVNGFCDNLSNGDCLYLTVDELQLELPVGLPKPVNLDGEPQLFPNPAHGQYVNVRLPESFGAEAELTILAVDGRAVLQQKLTGRVGLVDVSKFPPSVYVWTLRNPSGKLLTGKLTTK